jgi:hypothetical protein
VVLVAAPGCMGGPDSGIRGRRGDQQVARPGPAAPIPDRPARRRRAVIAGVPLLCRDRHRQHPAALHRLFLLVGSCHRAAGHRAGRSRGAAAAAGCRHGPCYGGARARRPRDSTGNANQYEQQRSRRAQQRPGHRPRAARRRRRARRTGRRPDNRLAVRLPLLARHHRLPGPGRTHWRAGLRGGPRVGPGRDQPVHLHTVRNRRRPGLLAHPSRSPRPRGRHAAPAGRGNRRLSPDPSGTTGSGVPAVRRCRSAA